MKNLKNIIELKNAVLCVVFPFVLFWLGLLLGAGSGSMLVYLVSMIPFYGYVYFGTNLYENTDCSCVAHYCYCSVFCWFFASK